MTNTRILSSICATGLAFLVLQGCSSSSTPTEDDAGPSVPIDAGDAATTTPDAADGGSCAVDPHSGTDTCDTCLATMCCSELVTCYGTDPNTTTACQMLLDCIQAAEGGDADAGIAGLSMADAIATCAGPDGGAADGGVAYSSSDVSAAQAMLECLGDGNTSANRCGSSCGGQ
jgi:hypothetical protein